MSIRQGIDIGMEKGIEKGALNEKIEIAKNLKSMGLPIQDISKATGLSEEEIENI
jgi:predicted transposase/invertase (TIGR01784 family)